MKGAMRGTENPGQLGPAQLARRSTVWLCGVNGQRGTEYARGACSAPKARPGIGRHACTAHRASDNHRAVRVAPCDAFLMSVAAAHELRRRMSGCARATGRVCPGGQRRKNFTDIKPTTPCRGLGVRIKAAAAFPDGRTGKRATSEASDLSPSQGRNQGTIERYVGYLRPAGIHGVDARSIGQHLEVHWDIMHNPYEAPMYRKRVFGNDGGRERGSYASISARGMQFVWNGEFLWHR
ncbi:hypothetical protein IEO21_02025 [Rhodonia placenta]|uniref:Uncharacterized protein n=1 Tax=Rhodonia placenta TaxID=104341 RepID=A0A8H7P8G0_9APHY|nr:hypothetical protein IEO21_02025 [Postia placenta]